MPDKPLSDLVAGMEDLDLTPFAAGRGPRYQKSCQTSLGGAVDNDRVSCFCNLPSSQTDLSDCLLRPVIRPCMSLHVLPYLPPSAGSPGIPVYLAMGLGLERLTPGGPERT